MERTTTCEQFMEKFGGKEASEFEESLKGYYGSNLDDKFCTFLWLNFENLPEEEKLKFTVEQAEQIKNDKFVEEYFHYITVSEMKINNENANEKLSELAKKFDSKDFTFGLNDFLIYYFSNSDSDSILSKFYFEYFSSLSIEFLIAHKNFFSFINDLLKQKYADFEYEDFLLQIEQNPRNVFDYLMKEMQDEYYNNLIVYLYIHMKFEEQTPERFGKLSNTEKNIVINYAENNESINITQEHVNLIIAESDYFMEVREKAQKILDSRNKQEHDTQNVQAKEIEGNKFNKICEGIKLFFAGLVSSGSIASIIVGAIALVSLLTLPFSPLILVGVGVPVLAGGGYFFYKSVKNLSNLNSMANESNVKEEKNDDNSAISKENAKDKNNISKPEFGEEEEEKSEIEL